MSTDLPIGREPPPASVEFLERIFAEQQRPLVRYATRLLGSRERARDVVQDTFVKLLAQPRAEIDGHVVEWLFTVCRHRAMDVLRKEGRMTSLTAGQLERTVAHEPRPGRALEEAETRATILTMIARLPPNQQEVVRLKFQHGFSYQEISRITELSVGNVGFLMHTAIRRLRTEFAAQRL